MLPLGPNGAICIDFITCILFVIQDMQEGDALFGQNGSHTMGIQHYCRACNVSAAQLDYLRAVGTFLVAADMACITHNPDQMVRTQWSQNFLNNAFDYVPIADPVRGILAPLLWKRFMRFANDRLRRKPFLVLQNVPAREKAAL
jgi:hypothetical protein